MTYAFQTSPTGSTMLVEMSARTARLAIAGRHDQARHGIKFEACDARTAHKWVLGDGLHATTLWVDRGKIRRA